MRKLILTGVAVAGFTCGLFAQGWFDLDNSASNYGLAINAPGDYYAATYGLEVWEGNGVNTAQINAINTAASQYHGAFAARALLLGGWSLEKTFANQIALLPGTIQLGTFKMPDVTPAGSTVGVALVAWNTSAANWNMIGMTGNRDTIRAGVYAYMQPTSDYTVAPSPKPPDFAGFNDHDLVMMEVIPEPSTFALAGLGISALWIFRRRKWEAMRDRSCNSALGSSPA